MPYWHGRRSKTCWTPKTQPAIPRRVRLAVAGSSILCILGAGLGMGGAAHAAGFFLQDQGIRGVGRAHAGDAAIADDASTIFFNPAGMTNLKHAEFDFGMNVIMPHTDVGNSGTTAVTPASGGTVPVAGNDGGNPFSPTPVGHLYLAYPMRDSRTWVGFGLSSPFGLNDRYKPGWFGRYDSTKSVLKTIDIAPTVAYRLTDYLSVGAGLDVQYASAKLENALPDSLNAGGPTAATDGAFRASGDSWSTGFNVGALITPAEGTRIGLAYRSAVTQNVHGDSHITDLTGPLAALNGTTGFSAKVDLPDIATLAIAHDLTPDLTLLGHVMWFGWSRFKEIRLRFDNGNPDGVTPENYRDTWAVAVGAEYALTPKWHLRGGFQYDETPSVNGFRDTRIPDGTRYWLSAGASYAITPGLDADLSVAHVLFSNEDINLIRKFYAGGALASTVNVNGTLDTYVDYVSVGLRYRF